MGRRRQGREIALQALYLRDVGGVEAGLAFDWATRRSDGTADEDTLAFARGLVLGVDERREELDALLSERAPHWPLPRMAAVDRNVLRLAAYELRHRPDTPVGVVIDEAIEIVRKYSSEESTRFVNGVLDALKPAPAARKHARPKGD